MTDSSGIVTSPARPDEFKEDRDGCCCPVGADPEDTAVEYEEVDADVDVDDEGDEEGSDSVLNEVGSDWSLVQVVPKGMMNLEKFSILGVEEPNKGVRSVGVSAGVTGVDSVEQISRLHIGH